VIDIQIESQYELSSSFHSSVFIFKVIVEKAANTNAPDILKKKYVPIGFYFS
jgi:hypothetical protein